MAYDVETASTTLSDGQEITISVGIANAEYVYLTIDDGTSGNKPATYDLTVSKDTVSLGGDDRTQFLLDDLGVRKRSYRFEKAGDMMEFTITNRSGGSATYEIEAESI